LFIRAEVELEVAFVITLLVAFHGGGDIGERLVIDSEEYFAIGERLVIDSEEYFAGCRASVTP